MNTTRLASIACGIALVAVLATWVATPTASNREAAASLPSGDFAIRDVRLFDGERVLERATVVVRGGRVVSSAANGAADSSLPIVDGKGMTLLPGLIDAHVHAFGDARRDALRAGVTTMVDQFGDWKLLAAARSDRESPARTDAADQWGAGTLATAQGGHGTQFGMAVPTLDGPEDAAPWVSARIAEGSDFIKIVREDAKLYRRLKPLPTLDRATAAAVIEAAHAQGRKAVMHVSTQEHAREAFTDGVDGIVHLFRDAPADPEFVELVQQRGGFVVATLAVIDGIEDLARERPTGENAARELTLLRDSGTSVRVLQAAGVPILAGSDAPNFGLAYGEALHAELDQLVAAGLTPLQALVSATSAPAAAFDIPERGRIAPGMRADLLLVRGDPTTEIKATRDIVGVWKNGFAVDRERAGGSRVPDLKGQPISDFEADTRSRYGSGWAASSDRMMGGKSTALLARIAGGAGGSTGALRVDGKIAGGFAWPWAGTMFSPGEAPMQAVDYSAYRELRFKVRGDGRRLHAMLLTGSPSIGAPPSREFETGPQWREVRLPLDSFTRADLTRVLGIGFNASSAAGDFWFELDDVTIQ